MKTIQSESASETKKDMKNTNKILIEGMLNTRAEEINSKHTVVTVISTILVTMFVNTVLNQKMSVGINTLVLILGSEFIHKMRTKDGGELQLWQKILMLMLVALGVAFLSKWFDYYMGDALVQNFRNWMGWK